jgi:hypothetical protein
MELAERERIGCGKEENKENDRASTAVNNMATSSRPAAGARIVSANFFMRSAKPRASLMRFASPAASADPPAEVVPPEPIITKSPVAVVEMASEPTKIQQKSETKHDVEGDEEQMMRELDRTAHKAAPRTAKRLHKPKRVSVDDMDVVAETAAPQVDRHETEEPPRPTKRVAKRARAVQDDESEV